MALDYIDCYPRKAHDKKYDGDCLHYESCDIRILYGILGIYKMMADKYCKKEAKEFLMNNKAVLGIKKAIRDKTNPDEDEEGILVKDDGIEGYVTRFIITDVPDGTTAKEIENWFDYEYGYHPGHSQYDCTGRAFTWMVSAHKLGGNWWVWHGVGYDV